MPHFSSATPPHRGLHGAVHLPLPGAVFGRAKASGSVGGRKFGKVSRNLLRS